ncbi:MAG: carboxypeptidase regulatory-like domain-containing protein, partial [Chloroflexi bacterium]|nr:carboxypeptidase regulatory-like domain-containing protein [Chloroflexota bacterium]
NSANTFHHAVVRYGGKSYDSGSGQCHDYMLWVYQTSPTISNNTCSAAYDKATYVDGGGPTITSNTVVGNQHCGIYVESGEPTINYNNIYDNTDYGLYNANSSSTINAENNWWGDASGPTHSGNPSGTGDCVSDYVDYTPWSTTPHGDTYSIPGQVTDGSSNPIPDVTISDGAGHTATTNSNGNYTLSGLTAGTYTITPSKSGYTFSPTSRVVTVPPDATGQDFTGTGQSAPSISNIQESADPINRQGCLLVNIAAIRADVTGSYSPVSSVRLYYQPPGGSWIYRTMGCELGSTYAYTVGPFNQAGTLSYFVWAKDDAGNEAETDTHTVTVRDCEFTTTFSPDQHGLKFRNFSVLIFGGQCLGMSLTPLDYFHVGMGLPDNYNHWIPEPYREDENKLQCYVEWRQLKANWDKIGILNSKREDEGNTFLRNAKEYEELMRLLENNQPVVLDLRTSGERVGHAVVVYSSKPSPVDHEVWLELYDSNYTTASGVGLGRIRLIDITTDGGRHGLTFSYSLSYYDELYIVSPHPRIPLIDPTTALSSALCRLPSDSAEQLQANGYAPQDAFGGTLNSGASSVYYPYQSSGSAPFAVLVNWEGSTMKLELYSPEGALYEERQSNSPPLIIEVPNPSPGEWVFKVTAVDVPYDDYPYVAVVGTKYQVYLPLVLCSY